MSRKKPLKHVPPSKKRKLTKSPPIVTSASSSVPGIIAGKVSQPGVLTSKKTPLELLELRIDWFLKHWIMLIWTILGISGAAIVTNIVTFIQNDPTLLWSGFRQYLPLILMLFFITVVALFYILYQKVAAHLKIQNKQKIIYGGATKSNKKMLNMDIAGEQLSRAIVSLVLPILIPATTTLFAFLLLFSVLLRPAWCPDYICIPPQIHTVIYSGEAHDENLEVYPASAQQNGFYVVPDPARHTIAQDSAQNVAAIRSDTSQQGSYHLYITVHNRHQSGYELYIDSVVLLVKALPQVTYPLYVQRTIPRVLGGSLYRVRYSGQPASSQLDAFYVPLAPVPIHQTLIHNETDTIDLQIDPAYNLQADLQFQVRITYNMANQGQEHILIPNKIFEVVFSNTSNWHILPD